MLIADVQPTASVTAGVDGPCRAIDNALDGLRGLQAKNVTEINSILQRAGLGALPAWTPPAAPACGKK